MTQLPLPPLPGPSVTGPGLRPRYAWSIPGFAVERPSGTGEPEIWCYTDKFGYRPGEVIDVHVHTTAARYDLTVLRDGASPKVVWHRQDLAGAAHPTPEDAYRRGCGWPVALRIEVDPEWQSGLYLLVVGTEVEGRRYEREHFVVVRPSGTVPRAPFALLLTTSTMIAYNDWGGANHYRGLGDDPYVDVPSPELSIHRPVARGMLRQPPGAPRAANPDTPGIDYVPRHPAYEWAHAHGYSRHYADAFWATYERPFVVWAERNGYAFDYLTQHDLHQDPHCLDGYRCAILVGHDEYWTARMRDTLDAFVDGGGNVARFGANFAWQIRLQDDDTTQVCYKDPRADPLAEVEPEQATTLWDAPAVGRPGAATMGLTAVGGGYTRYGSTTPRSSGGYTVYRPRHWVFDGTDLRYGDVFGQAPICVVGFEVDGVDYTVRNGLPYPTGTDGAPDGLAILAMAPAVIGETDEWQGMVPLGAPADEVISLTEALYGNAIPERMQGERYGAAMMAVFSRGLGTVFNAGTCEWVNGLIHRDEFTESITHNVLRRFATTGAKA